jgi:hypothetical protein
MAPWCIVIITRQAGSLIAAVSAFHVNRDGLKAGAPGKPLNGVRTARLQSLSLTDLQSRA